MSASAPPSATLPLALRALEPDDGVVHAGSCAFLTLLEAPSGRAFGLTWGAGEETDVAWAYLEAGAVVRCDANAAKKGERRFVELLECPRREVEDALEQKALQHGLDVGEVLRSLPSVVWVSAVLASRHDHLCRLGLSWLLPSELREAREAIAAVADDDRLQIGVRELARRLVVVEAEP